LGEDGEGLKAPATWNEKVRRKKKKIETLRPSLRTPGRGGKKTPRRENTKKNGLPTSQSTPQKKVLMKRVERGTGKKERKRTDTQAPGGSGGEGINYGGIQDGMPGKGGRGPQKVKGV